MRFLIPLCRPLNTDMPEESSRRRRLNNKRGWLIIAFAMGYCFEAFFVSVRPCMSLSHSGILLRFDRQPQLLPMHSAFEKRPRVLQILGTNDLSHNVSTTSCNSFHPQRPRENRYWEDNNDFEKEHYYHPARREEGCEPLGEWQDEHHPTCTDFHMIDFEEIDFVAPGNKRDTWNYQEYDGTKRALKMLRVLNDKHNHTYDYVNTEGHRREAAASMVLSKSPYIADMYSYCSNSAIFEFSEGGHLWTIFQKPPPFGEGPETPPTKDDLFVYAHDAAMGLADAHNFDSEGRVTIIHNDIKPSQFILMPNGRYQLGDFNGCIFPSWDPKRNEYCNVEWVKERERAADVSRLGQLFNYMLRGKRPYDDPTTVDIPANSTHPLDVYVKQAMEMCLRDEPMSSRRVARFLHAGYVVAERKRNRMAQSMGNNETVQ